MIQVHMHMYIRGYSAFVPLWGVSGLKLDFFYFVFSNVQPFRNTCLKGFVEIRKIPEVTGIYVAANA